ncbi:hypothetical protein F503_04209 [Ophiostoma piceae UAMH 11346]|uniref:Uncharacterized protein n=1 Tax=Ophiostoma piceae (strain UAMH 11346) TaxID=1262450 RepID=S3C744_OPHP1|nr:hypothetical protein F503_04209 [Ophiostoma piceae UAMH 11346]
MCGNDLPASAYAHRFGALAIMRPSAQTLSALSSSSAVSSPSSSPKRDLEQLSPLAGSVSFFNENDHGCHIATHVHFSPSGAVPSCPLLLSIGSSGSFGSIAITLDPSKETRSIRLSRPLHLHVGDDKDGNQGIIGHKITMQYGDTPAGRWTPADHMATTMAEGIVGFNSLPQKDALS